jgi:hypothetical protein
MRVTEQIDAREASAVDPYKFLAAAYSPAFSWFPY